MKSLSGIGDTVLAELKEELAIEEEKNVKRLSIKYLQRFIARRETIHRELAEEWKRKNGEEKK